MIPATLEAWGVLFGLVLVVSILVRRFKQGSFYRTNLRTVVSVFVAGSAIPLGLALISNTIFGLPHIAATEYAFYTSVGAVAVLWLTTQEVVAEFRSNPPEGDAAPVV